MIVGGGTYQTRAQEWTRHQVEGHLRLPPRLGVHSRLAIGIVLASQLVDRQPEFPDRSHLLDRAPIHLGEGRAQGLVAPHNLTEGTLSCRDVKMPLESDRQRQVVDRTAGSQLLQEPDALLGQRERSGVDRPATRYGLVPETDRQQLRFQSSSLIRRERCNSLQQITHRRFPGPLP
jgi:hypothetical protein